MVRGPGGRGRSLDMWVTPPVRPQAHACTRQKGSTAADKCLIHLRDRPEGGQNINRAIAKLAAYARSLRRACPTPVGWDIQSVLLGAHAPHERPVCVLVGWVPRLAADHVAPRVRRDVLHQTQLLKREALMGEPARQRQGACRALIGVPADLGTRYQFGGPEEAQARHVGLTGARHEEELAKVRQLPHQSGAVLLFTGLCNVLSDVCT